MNNKVSFLLQDLNTQTNEGNPHEACHGYAVTHKKPKLTFLIKSKAPFWHVSV